MLLLGREGGRGQGREGGLCPGVILGWSAGQALILIPLVVVVVDVVIVALVIESHAHTNRNHTLKPSSW